MTTFIAPLSGKRLNTVFCHFPHNSNRCRIHSYDVLNLIKLSHVVWETMVDHMLMQTTMSN